MTLFPSFYSDDVGEVFPISWIVQEVKDQQGYGSALLQEAYHQVCWLIIVYKDQCPTKLIL